MNTLEEIDEFFRSRGFSKFDPPDFASYKSVKYMYQKRYVDEKGTKYFIDAKIWDWTWTDKIKDDYNIEYEGQYYQAGTHNAVNFTFIGWELSEIETWLDELFGAGLLEHYDLD